MSKSTRSVDGQRDGALGPRSAPARGRTPGSQRLGSQTLAWEGKKADRRRGQGWGARWARPQSRRKGRGRGAPTEVMAGGGCSGPSVPCLLPPGKGGGAQLDRVFPQREAQGPGQGASPWQGPPNSAHPSADRVGARCQWGSANTTPASEGPSAHLGTPSKALALWGPEPGLGALGLHTRPYLS